MSDEAPELTPAEANDLVRSAEQHAQGKTSDEEFGAERDRLLGHGTAAGEETESGATG
jgi:hypothetical protein